MALLRQTVRHGAAWRLAPASEAVAEMALADPVGNGDGVGAEARRGRRRNQTVTQGAVSKLAPALVLPWKAEAEAAVEMALPGSVGGGVGGGVGAEVRRRLRRSWILTQGAAWQLAPALEMALEVASSRWRWCWCGRRLRWGR